MRLTLEQLDQVKEIYYHSHEGYGLDGNTFEKFWRALEDDNFVVREYKGEHLQYQYIPSDAGSWFEAQGEPEFYGGEEHLIEQLKGNRGAHLGAKARVRVVSDWEEYTLPVTAEDVLGGLKAYLKKHSSSSLSTQQVLKLVENFEKGENL